MDVAPEEPRVFSSKAPLMALLKKVKVARFKVFPTQGEAEVFASQEQASSGCHCPGSVLQHWGGDCFLNLTLQVEPVLRDVPDSPRPSEGSVYKSLTPQEEVSHPLFSQCIKVSPPVFNPLSLLP